MSTAIYHRIIARCNKAVFDELIHRKVIFHITSSRAVLTDQYTDNPSSMIITNVRLVALYPDGDHGECHAEIQVDGQSDKWIKLVV